MYKDGPGATYATDARHSIAFETRRVKKGDTLTLSLAPAAARQSG